MTEKQEQFVQTLYNKYNFVLKPFFAECEARTGRYEIQIVNELRSFFDHIARCYRPKSTEDYIDKQLTKAESHVHRALLDIMKILITVYHEYMKDFLKQTKNTDLREVCDGAFFPKYRNLYNNAYGLNEKAKQVESVDFEKAFQLFQNSKNAFIDLEKYITDNTYEINRAKRKARFRKTINFLKWFIPIIIGVLLAQIITCAFFDDTLLKILFIAICK